MRQKVNESHEQYKDWDKISHLTPHSINSSIYLQNYPHINIIDVLLVVDPAEQFW